MISMATISIDREITLSEEKYKEFLEKQKNLKSEYIIEYVSTPVTPEEKINLINKFLGKKKIDKY